MKTVLVSGAAAGIGRAVAEKFLSEGYRVIGMSRRAECEFSHENFIYISGDVSSAEDRERFVSMSENIDVLVNVAGVAPSVRRDINLKGTFFLTQLAANKMVARGEGGYICNISSISAYTSSTSRGEYCISKAGLSMVTSLFADRLAEHNIMVNEVRPGIIATDMTSGVKEKYDNLIEGGLLPIKRWGQPEDIASAVFALCNGSLPYVTGQSVNVDGGFHIRRL